MFPDAARWLLAVVSTVLLAQQTLRVDVVLQQVITTVHDGNGHLVPNLTADDFVVVRKWFGRASSPPGTGGVARSAGVVAHRESLE